MAKATPFIIAPIIGGMVFAGAATLTSGGSLDYSSSTEERQQKYLEDIARGFEAGFKATAGRNAEIKRISANPDADAISVDIQFLRKDVERATPKAIESFRKEIYTKQCGFLAKRGVLEQGISIRMRMTKPSGAPLTNFNVSASTCERYLKKTA